MSGLAIDKIIVVVNTWIRYVRLHLETEDGGRVLASLQGHLAGYKALFTFLCAEFGITEYGLEDNGDIPTPVCPTENMDERDLRGFGLELDDFALSALALDIATLPADPRWENVNRRIMEKTEELKSYLIDRAEKSRDLDVCQGERRGMLIAERLFNAVRNEAEYRERKREKERKDDTLPLAFDVGARDVQDATEPVQAQAPMGELPGIPAGRPREPGQE
jgi:hypothetical protein